MRFSPSSDTNGNGHGNIVAQTKNLARRMIEILDKEKGRSGLVDHSETYPGDEDDESQD
jgi:hypothetical protein